MNAWRVLVAICAAGLLGVACGDSSSDDGGAAGSGPTGGSGGTGAVGGAGGDGGDGGSGPGGSGGGEGGSGGGGGEDEELPLPDPFPHGACSTPRPTESPVTVVENAVSAPNGRFAAAAVDRQGNAYFMTILGSTYWRKPDGSFSLLGQFGVGQQVRGMIARGNVVWAFAGDTFESGYLVRIENGQARYHEPPGKSVGGVFLDGEGRLVTQLCTAPDSCAFYFLGDDFSVEETTNAPADLGDCLFLEAFSQRGFGARCWKNSQQYFVVGDDAASLRVISEGEAIDMARYEGRNPEDIWAFSPEGLQHFDGVSWVLEQEAGLHGGNGGGIAALAPADVAVITPDMLWHFGGSCWARLLPEGVAAPIYDWQAAGPVRIGDRKIGWIRGTTWVEVELP